MANTGTKIYTRLLKVSDDGLNTPLDEDGIPTSVSGKPQAVKLNIIGDEGYISSVSDTIACPTSMTFRNVNVFITSWTPAELSPYSYVNLELSEPLQDLTYFHLETFEGNIIVAVDPGYISSGNVSIPHEMKTIVGLQHTDPIAPKVMSTGEVAFFTTFITVT